MVPLTPLPTTRGTITCDRMWILNRAPRRSRDFDAGLVRHAHRPRPTLPPMQQNENDDEGEEMEVKVEERGEDGGDDDDKDDDED